MKITGLLAIVLGVQIAFSGGNAANSLLVIFLGCLMAVMGAVFIVGSPD